MRQKKESQNKKSVISIRSIAIIVLVAAIAVVCIILFQGVGGRFIEPNPNAGALVSSQLYNNNYIGSVKSDVSLFLSDTPPVISGGKELVPLENNYLGSGPDGDLLVDEAVVATLIRFNSNWVSYCLGQDDMVFNDLKPGSPSEEKIYEKTKDSQVAYHELSIGRIMTDGKDYYVTAREVYTLAKDGILDERDETTIYRFKKEGTRLLVFDFEVY